MDPADLHFREAYWNDQGAKAAFRQFAVDLFGLDFGAWDAAGFWDDAYRPFSLFDRAGRVVSSVCLYSMDLIVDGRPCRVGQLSAVGTRREWRRRGLAARLAEEALARSAEWGHSFQYLFADDEALPLYRRLGFRPIEERVTEIAVVGHAPEPGARRLDPGSAGDVALIHRMATARTPVSQRLGVFNDRLVMFYALVALREGAWWVEPLKVVVLTRRVEHALTILDVIGRRVPALTEIYRYLADPADSRLVVRLETDRLGDFDGLGPRTERPLVGNNLHVRGDFPLRPPVAFPITAQA